MKYDVKIRVFPEIVWVSAIIENNGSNHLPKKHHHDTQHGLQNPGPSNIMTGEVGAIGPMFLPAIVKLQQTQCWAVDLCSSDATGKVKVAFWGLH